jgi:hypothetical protein
VLLTGSPQMAKLYCISRECEKFKICYTSVHSVVEQVPMFSPYKKDKVCKHFVCNCGECDECSQKHVDFYERLKT